MDKPKNLVPLLTKHGVRATKQGQLQRWTEHSTLIFENLKPVEKSKNNFTVVSKKV